MHDREIVAAIVAGDPAGLAAAYDQHAQGLFFYCQSLLTEPADAADAVQNTFIIAAAKVSGLVEPGRFRAWLYAVARNDRGRAGSAASPGHPVLSCPGIQRVSVPASHGPACRAGHADRFADIGAGGPHDHADR